MKLNPEDYFHHQLNNSTSKASHPFPKEKRFNERKRYVTQSFYDLPSTNNSRTTMFGFGQKVSLINKSQSPPPGAYQADSSFSKQKAKITFGYGRQTVSFSSFLGSSKSKEYIPSPNKYSITLPKCKISGKISNKLPTQMDLIIKRNMPGPGTYTTKGCNIQDSGSYVLSTMKNNISPRLHTEGCRSVDKQMIHQRKFSHLGPSTYNPVEKEFGKSFNSKHKSIQVRTFSKSKRQGLIDKSKLAYPGAKYRRFSEFGNYI